MLILASASKARLELLESVGISPDKILNTNIDETPKKSEKPLDYDSRIALDTLRLFIKFILCKKYQFFDSFNLLKLSSSLA